MWIALLLFAAALFAAAAILSPIVWFFIPAIGLLALTIAIAAGLVGVAHDRPDDVPEHDHELDSDGAARRTGYAHTGQAPGHTG
jgi:hypothetical protein